jgi:hypothetical protein
VVHHLAVFSKIHARLLAEIVDTEATAKQSVN